MSRLHEMRDKMRGRRRDAYREDDVPLSVEDGMEIYDVAGDDGSNYSSRINQLENEDDMIGKLVNRREELQRPRTRTRMMSDLKKAAQNAVVTIPKGIKGCAKRSNESGGQYASQPLSTLGAPRLGTLAAQIPDAQSLVKLAAGIDAGYSAMVKGSGWAAKPGSDRVDNIEGLNDIGAQLMADVQALLDGVLQIEQGKIPSTSAKSGFWKRLFG